MCYLYMHIWGQYLSKGDPQVNARLPNGEDTRIN